MFVEMIENMRLRFLRFFLSSWFIERTPWRKSRN